jgi:hypothetical protein
MVEPIPEETQNILLEILAASGKYSNTLFIFWKTELGSLVSSLKRVAHSSANPWLTGHTVDFVKPYVFMATPQ